MAFNTRPTQVAVIGSGLAGAACAARLQRSGAQVTLFEKASTVGGHLAARRAQWIDADGARQSVAFDDSTQYFESVERRCKPVIARAMTASGVRSWRPHVYAVWPFEVEPCVVPPAAMSPLCTRLLGDAVVHLNRTVRRLQRASDGRWYVESGGSALAGPFDSVALALPPAPAAVLLAGHQNNWAEMLLAKRSVPVWTLIAVTADVDWPWDAAQPERGPFAWVQRNDRLPGCTTSPGLAVWTAHATAKWSAAHHDDDAQTVLEELKRALCAQLPNSGNGDRPICWHYTDVYRGHAPSIDCVSSMGSHEVWWDESLALGVCGNSRRTSGIQAAWYSGDQLAECMAASFERLPVTGYNLAALVATPRMSSHGFLPATNASAAIQQATGTLVSPTQGEVSHFADAE